jgi:predicted enzyme related to lactoylglutathione lyase
VIKNGENENGGVFPREDAPPGWIPYFGHEDVGRVIEEVPGLGGEVLNAFQMWQGSIGVVSDPQGAPFALWSGHFDD